MSRTARSSPAIGATLGLVCLLFAFGLGQPTDTESVPAQPDPRDMFTMDELRAIARLSPLGDPPLDPSNAYDGRPDAVELGHHLFFEPSLSYMGGISCATCHAPELGFSDGRTIAIGEGLGDRHTPTLWNGAYHRWQFWDGRADSLWSQALGPMETMHEMGSTRTRVLRAIWNRPHLRERYENIFGPLPDMRDSERYPIDASPVEMEDGGLAKRAWAGMSLVDQHTVNIAFANVGKAIGAYERELVSRRSPFDVFVEGVREGDREKLDALNESEKRGLKLFIGTARCTECHSGPNFTDGAFHNNRVAPLDGKERRDTGRLGGVDALRVAEFNRASIYSDAPDSAPDYNKIANGSHNWGAFKTPTLRNVELSPPYMHQGQLATLRDVLHHYNTLENATPLGHHSQEQILEPLGLTETELDDLETFLRSLTDVSSVDPALLERPRP